MKYISSLIYHMVSLCFLLTLSLLFSVVWLHCLVRALSMMGNNSSATQAYMIHTAHRLKRKETVYLFISHINLLKVSLISAC